MSLDHNQNTKHLNLDPVSDEPGAHLIGTGIGSALGIAAIYGSIVGFNGLGFFLEQVDIILSASIGGIAGGLAGKWVAEDINPTESILSETDIYQQYL